VQLKNAVARGEYVRLSSVRAQIVGVFATIREHC
jgi:hypothetical protein